MLNMEGILYLLFKTLVRKLGGEILLYKIIKVTPSSLLEDVIKQFNTVEKYSDKLLKIEEDSYSEVLQYMKNNRDLKVLEEFYNSSDSGLKSFRGVFNTEVNAYTLVKKIPRELFEESVKKGLVFSVRFKNQFVNEGKIKYIWFISEEVY